MKTRKNSSSVAENTLNTLLLFANYKGLTAREISIEMEMNITSVYRILNSMEKTGFIEKQGNVYQLTVPNVSRLYNSLDLSFIKTAKQVLKNIVEEHGESVYLSEITGDNKFTFIEKVDSPIPLRWSTNTKEIYNLPTGTSGKTHTAYIIKNLSKTEKIKFLTALNLEKYTQQTIVDIEKLIDSLNEIVEVGYSVTHSEHLQGVVGISVPIIRKDNGQVKNTLCMFMPEIRFDESKLPKFLSSLKAGAEKLYSY